MCQGFANAMKKKPRTLSALYGLLPPFHSPGFTPFSPFVFYNQSTAQLTHLVHHVLKCKCFMYSRYKSGFQRNRIHDVLPKFYRMHPI